MYLRADAGFADARKDSIQAARLLGRSEKEKDPTLSLYFAVRSLSIGQQLANPTIMAKAYRQLGYLYRPERRSQLYQLDSLFLLHARQSGNSALLFDALQCTTKDYLNNNEPARANKYLQELGAMAVESGTPLRRCIDYQVQSFYCFKRFRMAESLRYAIKSLNSADTLHDGLMRGRSLTLVGNSYMYLMHNDSAASYLFEALDVLKGTGDDYETGNAYEGLAFMFKTSANLSRAVEYYALGGAAYIRADHLADAAFIFIQVADLYLTGHKNDSAWLSIMKALALFKRCRLDKGIGVAYNSLGRYYNNAGQKDSAGYYYGLADTIARTSGDQLLAFYTHAYAAIDEIKSGNYVKGEDLVRQELARLHVVVPDTLINAANNKIFIPGHARREIIDTIMVNPYTGAPPQLDSLVVLKQQDKIAKAEAQFKVKEFRDSVTIAKQESQLARQQLNQRNLVLLFSFLLLGVSALLLYFQIKHRKQAQQEKIRALDDKATIERLKVEQDHRTGNTLNRIQAIIRRIKTHTTDNASFALLEEKINPLMVLYRILGKTQKSDVQMQGYLEEICEGLKVSYDHQDKVSVLIDAPVTIAGEKADLIGLIVCELMTNSFKHAFADQETGTISVICKMAGDGKYHLTFSDSGPGIQSSTGNGKQQGLLLIRALAYQMHAEILEKHEAGVNFEFYFM